MTDAEWAALELHLARVQPGGRPVQDARARRNAIFQVAVEGRPWRAVAGAFRSGKPGR